jgi:hypothetical protein
MVGFRTAPLVLAHTRKYAQPAKGRTRIRLRDWRKLAPALQKELSGVAGVTLKKVQAGTVDAGAAVQDTLRNRPQLAQSWMAPTIRSREHQQRRAARRSHEQIQLLRTIARCSVTRRPISCARYKITKSCARRHGRGMEFAAQPPGEVVHHINRDLEEVLDSQFENVQRRTGAANQQSSPRE